MDGKRIREYWSNEMQALLDTYKQFQVLIPAKIEMVQITMEKMEDMLKL